MIRRTLLLLFLSVMALPARAGELRAGAAKVDITPPIGTPLGGYGDRKGRPSTGKHDPIMAKALVLDDGATRVGIITTDLVGTNPEMSRKVAELAQFPREKLLICASHTHSGPGAYGKGIFAEIALGKYRQAVFDGLAEGMAKALTEAVKSLRPARLAIGESELPHFQRNRRKAKITDSSLWLLRVDTADGKPLASLLDLTAHGTVLGAENMEYSADWMGSTQAAMEREVPGLVALYANGAEGDISPNIPNGASTFEGAHNHGELGAEAALELYRSLKPSPDVTLEVKTATLDLPKTLKSSFLGSAKETLLQTVRINDALLIAVPGEMITQLGLALKDHARRQGVKHPVIIGLSNDHLGYLLTRAEMKKGGYETEVSFFGDDFGETLTLALGKLIGGDTDALKKAIEAPPPGDVQ